MEGAVIGGLALLTDAVLRVQGPEKRDGGGGVAATKGRGRGAGEEGASEQEIVGRGCKCDGKALCASEGRGGAEVERGRAAREAALCSTGQRPCLVLCGQHDDARAAAGQRDVKPISCGAGSRTRNRRACS